MNTQIWLKKIAKLNEWQLSGLLLVLYVAAEWGAYLVGGDQGAFLYVTSHFIVMPLLSALAIVLIAIRTFRAPTASRKLLSFSSVIIPCAIIFIAVTGKPGLSRFFGRF